MLSKPGNAAEVVQPPRVAQAKHPKPALKNVIPFHKLPPPHFLLNSRHAPFMDHLTEGQRLPCFPVEQRPFLPSGHVPVNVTYVPSKQGQIVVVKPVPVAAIDRLIKPRLARRPGPVVMRKRRVYSP